MVLTTDSYKSGLSQKESFLISSLAREKKDIFTLDDARKFIPHDTKKTVNSLVKKKWVLDLKRGLYALVPLDVGPEGADSFVVHNFLIAPYLVRPYYIGFWSALNYHGLTEQIPRDTFVATTRSKRPVKVLTWSYVFVEMREHKFFGYESYEIEGKKVFISSPEKTIVDCLDSPEHTGGIEEVAKAIFFNIKNLDVKKLLDHAGRMKNMAIIKRLGFILEKTSLLSDYETYFSNLTLTKGYPPLDPLAPKKGKHNSKWGLLLNVDLDPERWFY